MSKYSDKVKRREEMARRQIAKPLPAAPHEPTTARPSDGLALEARARCLAAVGDVHTDISLAHDLLVRAATVSDLWARCGVKAERFAAVNVKAQCRKAVAVLDKCLRAIAVSDFAPLEATNAPSPFNVPTKRPNGMHGEESPSTGQTEATKVA